MNEAQENSEIAELLRAVDAPRMQVSTSVVLRRGKARVRQRRQFGAGVVAAVATVAVAIATVVAARVDRSNPVPAGPTTTTSPPRSTAAKGPSSYFTDGNEYTTMDPASASGQPQMVTRTVSKSGGTLVVDRITGGKAVRIPIAGKLVGGGVWVVDQKETWIFAPAPTDTVRADVVGAGQAHEETSGMRLSDGSTIAAIRVRATVVPRAVVFLRVGNVWSTNTGERASTVPIAPGWSAVALPDIGLFRVVGNGFQTDVPTGRHCVGFGTISSGQDAGVGNAVCFFRSRPSAAEFSGVQIRSRTELQRMPESEWFVAFAPIGVTRTSGLPPASELPEVVRPQAMSVSWTDASGTHTEVVEST